MLNIERDRWTTFRRYYFEKHRDFLSLVWFGYQGYTVKNIKERVAALKKEDYADLENQLKIYDIEENTWEIMQHCKILLHDPDPCNIYLFIGFFSPDGFVLRYRGEYIICVGLERFHNFKNYDLLLAHEYCHYILNKQGGGERTALRDRLIREGISVYFSKLAYPGKKEHSYFFLSRGRFNYLTKNYDQIIEGLKERGLLKEELFSMESESLPPRSGYFIGYRLINEYMKRRGLQDIQVLIDEERRISIDI